MRVGMMVPDGRGDRAAGPGDGGPASFGTASLPAVPEAEACPPRRSGSDVARAERRNKAAGADSAAAR